MVFIFGKQMEVTNKVKSKSKDRRQTHKQTHRQIDIQADRQIFEQAIGHIDTSTQIDLAQRAILMHQETEVRI